MREALQELVNHDKKWVSKRAQMALTIAEQYDGGGLDEFDYQEIMRRLVEDGSLDREADDLDTKAQLINAIYITAEII
jgi:hypothetical protein